MPEPRASHPTGSYPAVTVERHSPPPSPPAGDPAWFAWVEQRLRSIERDALHARETATNLEGQIGRPPIPAAKDPGAGMWLVLADVRTDLTRVLEKLDAADAATVQRGGWFARLGWRVLETLIPIAIVALLAYVGGFHR